MSNKTFQLCIRLSDEISPNLVTLVPGSPELKYRTLIRMISLIYRFVCHFTLFLFLSICLSLNVHRLGSCVQQIVALKHPDAQKIKISPTYSMLTLEKNSPQLYRPKDPIFLDLIWAQSGLFLFMTLVPISLKIAK